MSDTITLSVEPTDEPTFIHGFHLGTDEELARVIAADLFHGRNHWGMWTRTVALIRAGRIIDIYDGRWDGDRS